MILYVVSRIKGAPNDEPTNENPMPQLEKIRQRLRELIQRRKNVTFAEIETVLNQLPEHGYSVKSRKATHGKLFNVNGQRFMICCHNPGSKQVKSFYVKELANAMIELDLYDED